MFKCCNLSCVCIGFESGNTMLYSVIPEPPLQPLGGGCFDKRYSLCYDQNVLISSPEENLVEQSFSEPPPSYDESLWLCYSPLKPMCTLHLTPSPCISTSEMGIPKQ